MDNLSRVISYVVASDTGLAPNVTGGACSLAVCKPVVRRIAEKGDLIIGLSTAKDDRHKLIYAMTVGEKISFESYFDDPRFQDKKPDQDFRGDNFFKQNAQGDLEIAFRNAAHFGKELAIKRDLNTPLAIIGNKFWYFGENAPLLPSELHYTKLSLCDDYRRGHRVTTDENQINILTQWLSGIKTGIHGNPRDLKKTLKKLRS